MKKTGIILVLLILGMVLPVGTWYGPSINLGPGADTTRCLALADFDKDGFTDIVAGNHGGQNVIYFGDGDGTFDTRQSALATAVEAPLELTQAIVACDVNNDTWDDIVVGNDQQSNLIYMNDQDGTFDTIYYTFSTGSDWTFALAADDVNGDTLVDLAVGNLGQLNYVYLNDGSGNPYDIPANAIPFGVDMNGDTLLDLLYTWDLVFAYMNGDSNLDLVEANHQTFNYVYIGDGTGNFGTAYGFGLSNEFTHSVAVGDLNGDTISDVVEGNYQGQNRAYLGTGTGSMGASYNFGTVDDRTHAVALADVDGDTNLDVVVADGGDVNEINTVYFGDGDGTFGSVYDMRTGDTSWDVKFGYFNGDASIDIAVANVGQNYVYLDMDMGFDDIATLFDTNTFFVAGDNAYCTDVLGSAKIAFGLGQGGASENPEGRTDEILTATEHDTGNLIPVGGPAINPVADEFGSAFAITYDYQAGVSFTIFAHGHSIVLDLTQYPNEDICIVYLSPHNSRNVMLVWGYGWQGTYAGSAFVGDPNNWTAYQGFHMLLIRWTDSNADGLVQMGEITVEDSL
ncbi:MAG: hypothetical protein AYK19_06890 [Theionarchaea archaeon DG-70-1]|nr:MAG: hypothetical protein AYK19_06890 [Theionarchaea archaeon DG-70-1]